MKTIWALFSNIEHDEEYFCEIKAFWFTKPTVEQIAEIIYRKSEDYPLLNQLYEQMSVDINYGNYELCQINEGVII